MMTAFHDPAFFTLTCAALGLVVGSFLNVVILRLPKMMEQGWQRECCEVLDQPVPDQEPISLSHPGSHCPGCGAAIKPWQNIPVISWLVLRGQCAQCGMGISMRYPAVELVTGVLSGLAAWQFGFGIEALSALALIWMLVALAGIDIDTQLLPDSITLPLLWLGLAVNLFAVWTPLSSAVIGAMLGYGSLWSVYWLFKLVTGKEGMGYGDFKLLGALGAWFGWQAVPLMILLSSFVGAALGIAILLSKRQGRDTPMPFGPYLAGAGLLTLFFGDTLITEYLQLVTF
ncbi:MAG: A24 family peptidase [Luminiphilus sp.]|jgi:leader peptidase (prepilin peptidase)/N-methyltransferase